MKKLVKVFPVYLLLSFFVFFPVFAHPGNTDVRGCHTCRTNCAKWGLGNGEYHCHKQKNLPQPQEPVKSKFSETGGVTVPAPEYKNEPVEVVKYNTPNTIPNTKNDTQTIEVVTSNTKEGSVEKKERGGWFIRLMSFIFGD